jgi:hypothetical protein
VSLTLLELLALVPAALLGIGGALLGDRLGRWIRKGDR